MPATIDPVFLPSDIVKADISTDDQGRAFIRWWPNGLYNWVRKLEAV